MSDTPQLLLAHHLKALKLPTFLREYRVRSTRPLLSPVNSMKPDERDVLHQAQADQDGNDSWRNELAIEHVRLLRNFVAEPTLWDRSADTASSFAQRTWLVRSRPASNLCTPAGKRTERFGDGRRASLRSPTGSTRTL